MDAETPTKSISLAPDCGAVLRDLRGVIGAPALCAAGGDASAVFGLDEFDPAPIGECLLGRIDDLHDMAMSTAAGELSDDLPHVGDLAPQVRKQNHLGER
jgi:hypothetical protein